MVGVYWEHPRKMDDDWGDPHFRKAPHAAGKIHQEMDVAMDVAMVDVAMFDSQRVSSGECKHTWLCEWEIVGNHGKSWENDTEWMPWRN